MNAKKPLVPYNQKYELNSLEQIETLEKFLCTNMQFTYNSEEYHDEYKNPNEYEIFSNYNSTCLP